MAARVHELGFCCGEDGVVVPPDGSDIDYYQVIRDAGIDVPQRLKLNFIGDSVTVTDSPGTNSTIVTINAAEQADTDYYQTVQDEGTPLTQRDTLNFIGDGVTVTDNSGDGTTDVTIPSYTDVDPFVNLQSSTPGTPDTGNFNISNIGIIGGKLGVGNTAPNVAGDFSGAIASRRLQVTLANGANNDVDISTAGMIGVVGPTGAFSISGFQNGYDGRRCIVSSEVAQAMTITDDSGSSSGNKIYTGVGGDVAEAAEIGATLEFVYNATLSHWCLLRGCTKVGDHTVASCDAGFDVESASNVQTFTEDGTWSKPGGTVAGQQVMVRMIGAGGSGSGAQAQSLGGDAVLGGGGGGGGKFVCQVFDAGDLPSTVTVKAPAGPAGGHGADGTGVGVQNGADGGNAEFGTLGDGWYLSAAGGKGGLFNGSNGYGGQGGGGTGRDTAGTGDNGGGGGTSGVGCGGGADRGAPGGGGGGISDITFHGKDGSAGGAPHSSGMCGGGAGGIGSGPAIASGGDGGPGADGDIATPGAGGGGGGGSSPASGSTEHGGFGGKGGNPGGGGGGGGAMGNTGLKGGDGGGGGNALVVVYTFP